MPDTPQFALPFRENAPEVEQDSAEEVVQSVETLIRTPLGFHAENPDYGVSDPTFEEGGPSTNEIMSAIDAWEPRADPLIEEGDVELDGLVANIRMTVNVRSDA